MCDVALRTRHVRGGETVVKPYGWGAWHLQAFADAMRQEAGVKATACPDEFVFQARHEYHDPSDGESLTILPGDVYETWLA